MNTHNPFLELKARSLLLWFFLLSLLIGVVVGFLMGLFGLDMNDPILTYILYCFIFIAISLWAIRRFKVLQINLHDVVGSLPAHYRWLYLVGIVFALILFSLGSFLIVAYLLGIFSPNLLDSFLELGRAASERESEFPVLYSILEFTALVVIAPIAEEFIFRGILLHRWATKWGMLAGILVSSIVFGVLHLNAIGLTVFGVVMAVLYIQTKSLLVPIIAHALNNLIAFSFQFLASGQGEQMQVITTNELFLGLIYWVLSIPVLGYYLYKNFTLRKEQLPYFFNSNSQ